MSPTIACRVAREARELEAYYRLRRSIFCDEQRLFDEDDRDEKDDTAVPIVSVLGEPSGSERVIGVVRIYEQAPGVWYGGRLGVDEPYRRVGHVGRGLIVKAVTLAHAWGCREFLAIVQLQNVPLFRRLHWRVVDTVTAHGRPHTMMTADLAHYPAAVDFDVALRPKAPCHDAA
jgi:putative N-acetyltransferase (TIGR04045 family)